MASQTRGKADRVWRLRSQLWFSLVCAQSQMPWDDPTAMDKFFLKRTYGPFRTFERIRDNSSNPGLKRGDLLGRSVVELVAEKREYRHTQAAFESPLWSMLSGAPWCPVKRETEIDRLMHQFELYESEASDRFILSALRALDFIGSPSHAHFLRVLGQLASERSLDGIMLLCLLFRRYLEIGRLQEACDVRDAVLSAIHRYCDRPGFHRNVHTLWVFITRRRVFAGQPSLEHTPQAIAEASNLIGPWEAPFTPSEARRWSGDQCWLYACMRENAEDMPASKIISRNQEVESFISARDNWITLDMPVSKILVNKTFTR